MDAPVALLVPCPNHPEVATGLASCAQCGRNFCDDCLVQLGGASTCASCKWERLNDLRSGTAELDLAGPGARLVAQFVDGAVVVAPAGVFYVLVVLMAFTPRPARQPPDTVWPVLLMLLWFAFVVMGNISYEALMLTWRGQTLGKMLLGTKVVTPQGGAITKGQAWIRAASRVVINLLCLGPVDALFVFSERRRTLHDRIAQTLVVRAKR